MADIILNEGNNTLDIGLIPIAPAVANLTGIVTDADTRSRLQGVKVTIDGLVTYTNITGWYGFEGLEVGGYVVEFSKEGYETVVM